MAEQNLGSLRKCGTCAEEKLYSEFYRGHGECRRCGVKRSLKWNQLHPERAKKSFKKWYAAHIDEIRAKDRARPRRLRVLSPSEKAQKKVYMREWMKRNRERMVASHQRWVAKDPEHVRQLAVARTKKWLERNPERAKESRANSNHKRRARSQGVLQTGAWAEIKMRWDYRCLACGKSEPEITLTMDHVIPLSAGGPHNDGNIQPLCRPCNTRKHTKIIDYRLPVVACG